MTERIDYQRSSDRTFPNADRLKAQLRMSLDLLDGLPDPDAQDSGYAEYDSFIDERNSSPSSAFRDYEQVREARTPMPSYWGAAPIVDLPVEPDYFERPVPKDKIKLPSRRVVAYLLMAGGVTGTTIGWGYDAEIDNPYSFVASLPVIGKDDPAKKELLDSLLANCVDQNVGDVLYRGNVSAESSMIWNVLNADGTLSPLLPTRLDPGSEVERHPKAVVENAILSVGVCDEGNRPAVNIRGDKVTIDFSRVKSRVALEGEKVHAESIQKERLDASVKVGAFPQETADALYAEMTNPANIAIVIGDTLRNAGNAIIAPGGTYDKQVEDVSRSQLIVKITEQLAAKTPGVSYTIETVNEFDDTSLVGLPETMTDKVSVTDTKVTNAAIAIIPNSVSS